MHQRSLSKPSVAFLTMSLLGTSLAISTAAAQPGEPVVERDPQQTAPANTAATGRQRQHAVLGGFLGYTDRHDADFTVGLQFEYPMSGRWSAGAVLEHTPDYFRQYDATLLMGSAHFRPRFNSRLKFTGGAGVDFRDGGSDEIKFRTGLAYDVFVEGPLTLTPRIAFNFGEGEESFTLGAGLHYSF